MLEAEGMNCKHCWMPVDVDLYRFRSVYVEYCPACHASREVTVWEDGEREIVYHNCEVTV